MLSEREREREMKGENPTCIAGMMVELSERNEE
jgi:hypothetical protein